MLNITLRIIDIVLGTVGLLLIIRVILNVFRVSRMHPVMRFLNAVTDPLIAVVKRIFGIPGYQTIYSSTPSLSADILNPLVALIAIWVLRTVLVWAIGLIMLFPTWARNPVSNIGAMLRHLLSIVFSLYIGTLFIRILLQWLQVPYSSRIMRFLWDITEPLLSPIRRILPPMMGFDLSPLIAYFLLRLLEGAVMTLLSWVF
jgi:YggT family protein